jgi:hypothetical protein
MEYIVNTGIQTGMFVSFLVALPLQLLGLWYLMPLAGAVGGALTKRARYAFIAGFMAIGGLWSMLYIILNELYLLYEIADVLAIFIGFPFEGRWLVSLGTLLGGLFGGTGATSGRLLIEIVKPEEIQEKSGEIRAPEYRQPLW